MDDDVVATAMRGNSGAKDGVAALGLHISTWSLQEHPFMQRF